MCCSLIKEFLESFQRHSFRWWCNPYHSRKGWNLGAHIHKKCITCLHYKINLLSCSLELAFKYSYCKFLIKTKQANKINQNTSKQKKPTTTNNKIPKPTNQQKPKIPTISEESDSQRIFFSNTMPHTFPLTRSVAEFTTTD